MAALTAGQLLRKEHNREWQEGFANYKSRVMEVGQYGTLSGENFEVGDTLSDDSTYEIIKSDLVTKDGFKAAIVVAVGVPDVVSGQTPWSEIRETRRNMDTREVKRLQITFKGTTTAARPRRGQTYGKITGTATSLSGDGVDLEPRVAHVGEVKEVTRTISYVTVTFEAYWACEGSLSSTSNYLCTANRQHWADEGDETGRDTGVERYYVSPAYSPAKVARKLRGRLMKGTSGDDAMYCYDTIVDRMAYGDGGARVTALYKLKRKVGKVIVELDFASAPREVDTDRKGKLIAGPRFDGTMTGHGLNYRKIVRGSNVIQEGRGRIILKVAYERDSFYAEEIARIMAGVGGVNDSELPNLGGFGKGTLRLMGAPHTKTWNEFNLWYANFVLEICPALPMPWNEWTQTQDFTKITTRVPIYEKTGNEFTVVTGAYQRVEFEVPRLMKATSLGWNLMGGTTEPESTFLHEEVDFGALFCIPVPGATRDRWLWNTI